ncbi:MAG TPA: 50S ribosomal protein L35 [Candidatus Paceibacterota bacterium]|nr:50S ribosomal protein L35 [Candidatus Paceibacterota bacterium]
MKTNKSYSKRIRVTKNGKLVARKPGQNHFNAKESSSKQMARNRLVPFAISNKSRSRFIVSN